MLTTRDLMLGILLPAALAAAVLTAGWWTTRRRLGHRDGRLWAGPMAIGVGFGGGWLTLFGREHVPPVDVTGWLFIAMVPLVALASAEAWYRFPPQVRVGAGVLAVGALFWLLAAPRMSPDNPDRQDTLLVLTVAVPLAVGWIVVTDQMGRRVSSARLSAIFLATGFAAAWALGHSGTQRLAQIAAALAATQGGLLAASLWLGPSVAGRGVALVFGVLSGGLLVCGCLYAELRIGAAFALFVAPCAAWLAEPWARRLGPRQTAALQLALVAGTACAAAYLSR